MNSNEGDYYPLSRTMLTPLQYRYSKNNSVLNQTSNANLFLDDPLASRYQPLNLISNSQTSAAQTKQL